MGKVDVDQCVEGQEGGGVDLETEEQEGSVANIPSQSSPSFDHRAVQSSYPLSDLTDLTDLSHLTHIEELTDLEDSITRARSLYSEKQIRRHAKQIDASTGVWMPSYKDRHGRLWWWSQQLQAYTCKRVSRKSIRKTLPRCSRCRGVVYQDGLCLSHWKWKNGIPLK